MGLTGSLGAGEILEQVVHANRILADEWEASNKQGHALVNNVVFMGMVRVLVARMALAKHSQQCFVLVTILQGEPLDNYKNVVEACRALIDRRRWSEFNSCISIMT